MANGYPLLASWGWHHLTKSNASTDPGALRELERNIGHVFANKDIAQQALNHSSAVAGLNSYQRLEFLGDRVLGLVLAEYVFRHHSKEAEGDLSRRLHAAAQQSALVAVAEKLELARYVNVQAGFDVTANGSVLSDVVEALIAAIYLDAGLEVAAQFISTHFTLDSGILTHREKDPKTQLQELVLKQSNEVPIYRLIEKTGPDHAPEMRCEVCVAGFDPVSAVGSSRKIAEQRAASALLALMQGTA